MLQTLNNDYEAEFSIPVRIKDVPNNVVLTSEPPSELRVRVKDKGTVLLNYMLGKSFFPVNLNFADYKGKDNHVKIPATEFEKKIFSQLSVSSKVLSVKPDTLDYIYSAGCTLSISKNCGTLEKVYPAILEELYTTRSLE